MTPFDIAIANRESGGADIGYHNRSRSTAAGRYGITDTTWGGLMRNYPQAGLTWGNRLDPTANQTAWDLLKTEQSTDLKRRGIMPNDISLGLATMWGPAGATALLTADPSASAFDVLASAVGRAKAQQFLQANPETLNPNTKVADIINGNTRAMGGSPGSGGGAVNIGPGPIQPTALPPMPSDFATPTQPPPGAVKVDRTGREGDPLVAMGLGLMSGGDWREGWKNALAAYQNAQGQLGQDQRTDAQYANAAADREFRAPAQAAETAALRTRAWSLLNPTISPTDALNANIALRGQDQRDRIASDELAFRREDANRRQGNTEAELELRRQEAERIANLQKKGDSYIQDTPDGPVTWTESRGNDGKTTFKNTTTGETSETIPAGAVPASTYNAAAARTNRLQVMATKDLSTMMEAGTKSAETVNAIDRAIASVNDPNANVGAGWAAAAKRGVLGGLGLDVADQQVANMNLSEVSNLVVQGRAHGLGPMSDADRKAFAADVPLMGSDPEAARRVLQRMRDVQERNVLMARKWNSMTPQEQQAVLGSGSIGSWKFKTNEDLIAEQQARRAQTQPQPAVTAPPGQTNSRAEKFTPKTPSSGATTPSGVQWRLLPQ